MQPPWSPPERPVPIDAPLERFAVLGVGAAVFVGAALLACWTVSRYRARGQAPDEWRSDVQAACLGFGLFLLAGGMVAWRLLLNSQPPLAFWAGVGTGFGAVSSSVWCWEIKQAFEQRYSSLWEQWSSGCFSALVAAASLLLAAACGWLAFTL